MISLDVARRLAQALRPSTPDVAETSGGVVTRLDNDGTVWVQLHGADEDTPCTSRTAAVHVGDAVTVTIDGGSARVDGNVTRPATDDERAEEAHELAAQATEEVSEVREQTRVNIMATAIAQSIAEQAQSVADAINQHFFADTNGVHVTEAEGDPTTEHNILINSLGILLRHAVNPLVSITQSAIAFYDGLGSAASNIVAQFGTAGFQVGMSDESHLVGDYHSLQLVDKEGSTYFHVSDLRDASGKAYMTDVFTGNGSTTTFMLALVAASTTSDYTVTVSDGSGGTVTKAVDKVTFSTAPTDGATITVGYATKNAAAKAYTLGSRGTGTIGARSVVAGAGCVASGAYSHAEGYNTTASGLNSHAEGYNTTASKDEAHAEGYNTTASGYYSHAEGQGTEARNYRAHAEGYNTTASGQYSHAEGRGTTASQGAHAEGYNTTASGAYSHAEGYNTTASAYYSHAEGSNTESSGQYSHAQNRGTKAAGFDQTAIGRYNVEDSAGDYALIIGNGSSDSNRSNALTVKWNGNVDMSHLNASSITLSSNINAVKGTFSGALKAASLELTTPLPPSEGGTGSTGFGDIKTDDISTAVSVSTATWKSIGSVALGAGDWIVSYNAYFASNATGRRGMLIHTAADTTSTANLRQGGVEVMAVNGGVTMLNGCRVLHLTASSTTYYLNVMQSSGANLNVTGYIRAFRLT